MDGWMDGEIDGLLTREMARRIDSARYGCFVGLTDDSSQRHEILTAVLMTSHAFWDVTLCRLVDSCPTFRTIIMLSSSGSRSPREESTFHEMIDLEMEIIAFVEMWVTTY
jgi:hypothetical protein